MWTFRNLGPFSAIALALTGSLAAQEATPSLDIFLQSARASYARGDYKTARTALDQAWALAEQTPPEEPKRYDVLKQQYAVSSAAGQYEEAERYLQLAINWRENTLGHDNPKVADDLTELALLCRNLKDIPRGLGILQIVSDMHIRTGGMQTALFADDQSRMALLHMDDNKPARAAEFLRTAIIIRENLLGPDHYGLLPELIRLGTIWVLLREYDKAEQVYRHALVVHERALGPANPDLIPTVEGLAYALFGQKKYSEAEPYYLRLLALWQTAGGKDHPMLALTLEKLAVFYREQDRRAEADAAIVRANAIRALFYATGLSEEALVHMARGENEEAQRLYRTAAAALDSSRSEHQELLSQIETNLKQLAPTSARKAAPKSSRKP
jgi:tetratricopeptide (TPR) repeat protein